MQSDTRSHSHVKHRRAAETIAARPLRHRSGNAEKTAPRRGDKIKLIQLCVCGVLFLSVFLVKTFSPDGAEFIKANIIGNIEQGMDYKEVFGAIGKAIGSGEGKTEVFKNIYGGIFENNKVKNDASGEKINADADAISDEPAIISDLPGESAAKAPGLIDGEKEEILAASNRLLAMRSNTLLSRGFWPEISAYPYASEAVQTPAEEKTAEAKETPEALPPVPDIVNMENIKLDIKSVTPLKGRVSSEFGYRDHPVDGEYKFHYGLDIAGAMGDDIVSYADGKVYEVGENNTYGKYVRIEHKNGITSFYGHCSKILVKEGQTVKLGERIARVGQTGQATGPHLHFEIRKDGRLLNPAFYISP